MIKDKEKELKIEDKVIHTGSVPDNELVDLYNLVDLFIFPSLYEGFGLPVIEAMACGTKVVSSNSSSLPEVGGDKVLYFDPKNIEEMKQAIEKELEREDSEEDKQKRIKWAKSFDFKKTSEEVKAVFALYEKQ